MAKKKPAATAPLKRAATDYWGSALALRNPPSPDNAATGDSENAPHGTRPSPDTPHRPSDGGSGGGGSTTPPVDATPDWEQTLIAMGMPAALVSEIGDYMRVHADDPDLKTKVLYVVRGSDWWKQTFPGFWAGSASGLFSDETGYRSWYKAANDAFKRSYGRDMNANEVVGYLTSGYSPGTIEAIGAGHSYAEANKGDINYLFGAFDQGQLSDADRETLGQQYAGRTSTAGSLLQQKFEDAQRKMSRVFQGVLASPSLSLGSNGLSAPSLGKPPDLPA